MRAKRAKGEKNDRRRTRYIGREKENGIKSHPLPTPPRPIRRTTSCDVYRTHKGPRPDLRPTERREEKKRDHAAWAILACVYSVHACAHAGWKTRIRSCSWPTIARSFVTSRRGPRLSPNVLLREQHNSKRGDNNFENVKYVFPVKLILNVKQDSIFSYFIYNIYL